MPAALGCRGWFTARIAGLGELDAAVAPAAAGETARSIEVIGGRMDFLAGLALAHRRLDALYENGWMSVIPRCPPRYQERAEHGLPTTHR